MDACEASHQMTEQRAATRWFWCFIGGHLLFWTLVPFFANCNAPLDCIEMLYWGQEWQWGYYKHPPLPAWFSETGRLLFGSVDWPLYLASQLCVVTCFWAAWRMARQCLSAWPALAATVILEACYYFSFMSTELNNNMLAKACWAIAILTLYFAIQTHFKRYWIASGVALALAALAKYDVALLIVSMLAFSVFHRRGRQCWQTPGPYLLALASLICVTPHLLWLIENDFLTIQYFRNRSAGSLGLAAHLLYPLRFAVSQFLSLSIVFLLASGVLGWRWRWRTLNASERFNRDYLLTVVLGPMLLAMLYSLIAGAELRSMWGASMWTYIGVLLFMTFRSDASSTDYYRLCRRGIAVGVLLAMLYASKLTFIAEYANRPSRTHFPGRVLAQVVQDRWRAVSDTPLCVVGGDWWLAGNVAFYSGTDASVYPDLRSDWSPWTSDQEMKEKGGVLLWDAGQSEHTLPGKWAETFPEAQLQSPIDLAWHRLPQAKPIQIGIAVIAPATQTPMVAQIPPHQDAVR